MPLRDIAIGVILGVAGVLLRRLVARHLQLGVKEQLVARGFTWGVYVDDDGNQWSLQVDADRISDPERGWAFPSPVEVLPFPRGWLPRRATGVDASGRFQSCVVATTEAPLWTGEASEFTVEASDGTLQTVALTGTIGERTRARPKAT